VGRASDANDNWYRAKQLLEPLKDPYGEHLVALTQAQSWHEVPARAAELNTIIQAITQAPEGQSALSERAEDLRIAMRLLNMG
jgi:hypothetical protein